MTRRGPASQALLAANRTALPVPSGGVAEA